MRHRVTVTVIGKKLFPDLQEAYLAAVPTSGVCPCFTVGQQFHFWREGGRGDFWRFGRGALAGDFPCAEAWDCISRHIYTALQGGSLMHGWTNDDRIMIACCNDGTRPVIFKIEREDIPCYPALCRAAHVAGLQAIDARGIDIPRECHTFP